MCLFLLSNISWTLHSLTLISLDSLGQHLRLHSARLTRLPTRRSVQNLRKVPTEEMSKTVNEKSVKIPRKRERSTNFTREETDILIQLINENKLVLENKKSDAVTWAEKEECWQRIEAKFNSISSFRFRSAKSLKIKYDGMKRETVLCNQKPKTPFEMLSEIKLDIVRIQKQILEEELVNKRKQWSFEEEERQHKISMWVLEKELLQNKIDYLL